MSRCGVSFLPRASHVSLLALDPRSHFDIHVQVRTAPSSPIAQHAQTLEPVKEPRESGRDRGSDVMYGQRILIDKTGRAIISTHGLSWCLRGLGLGGFHPVPWYNSNCTKERSSRTIQVPGRIHPVPDSRNPNSVRAWLHLKAGATGAVQCKQVLCSAFALNRTRMELAHFGRI